MLAIQKAGQLLKPLGPGCRRVLALLTDGRIDSHQVGGGWGFWGGCWYWLAWVLGWRGC